MDACIGSFRLDSEPHLKRASEDALKAKSAASTRPGGSYGVSIRVQGIDGHPYLVLNNAEESVPEDALALEEDDLPLAAAGTLDRSGAIPGARSPPEHEKRTVEAKPHSGTCALAALPTKSASPKPDRAVNDRQAMARLPKSSSLLNFQRHPELLQPYDPDNNILEADGFQSPLRSLGEEERMDTEPWGSPLTVNKTTRQFTKLARIKPKTVDLTMPAVGEGGSREDQGCPRAGEELNGAQVSPTSSGGSPYATSPPTVQEEPRKCRPDLLPFRRQDSAVSAPICSRRSSSSSATPTSAASLYKFFLDDQECAIYADNVNRHENRRYIPFLPGTGRDIDTGSIPAVDRLIEKFDKKVSPHRRGRLGMRNRIRPEDRKRSRSVDSGLSSSLQVKPDCLDGLSKKLGKSSESIQSPAKASLQKPLSPDPKSGCLGQPAAPPRMVAKLQAATAARDLPGTHYNSLQYHKQGPSTREGLSYKSSTLPGPNRRAENKGPTPVLRPNQAENNSVKQFASATNTQVTPDLLKGQQGLSRQTNEETAKQILYNYLKEGSGENDDATKRKVNLVFEKIQTLKSRAAGSNQASEASAEVKVLGEQKEELEKEAAQLRSRLDLEARNHQNTRDERDALRTELKALRQELQEGQEEKDALQRRLEGTENDLRQNLEELFQVKMEREQHQREIRDMQDQLSEMHDELDRAKHLEEGEKELLVEELLQLKQDQQDHLGAKEQLEEALRRRERELTALKGALKEEVSSHDQEMDRLKEQHDQELQALRRSLEEAQEKAEVLSGSKAVEEERKKAVEAQVVELTDQNQHLKGSMAELESHREDLQLELEKQRAEQEKLGEWVKGCQEDQQRLEDALARAEAETQALALAKTSLEAQLEEAQKHIRRLNQEQQQLTERLKDEASEKDRLKRMRSELENERGQLDKAIEKLHQEMAEIVDVSRTSTLELQNQLEEYKENNRRELAEAQRQLKDKILELEKARLAAVKLQEEVRFMEEEVRDHQRAQDEAVTKTQLLERTVKALEYEVEAKNHVKEDRARQAKIMEDKISQLEVELEEERNSSDILSGRISRCREQIEQMRSELLQERAARQDLECDKISLERQTKDLKSRILHLEGSYRSSKEGLLVQMETRVVELEERLENEERDRANLQMSNRRLERRVKELMMQVDDEHLSLTDQKDQLSLRLKAMKRQVEEAEEEIDRLESAKKKLQRDLEEQLDLNDQLQGQISGIRQELRRKKTTTKVLSDLDDEDDDFSTDGESLYEVPSGFKFVKDNDAKS